ncbi:unnamed protein product [Rhizoctonia solani]|uniref:Knr4/Smi1-like domain-containing protein n=1 Tax=Rhizoctonia solani TaxID=456999 RepID=A0A8H2XI91_9AGAM|nr:unnamed protein product [Rhizoctonia solani]
MPNYFSVRIAGVPKQIIYLDDEHNVVRAAVILARDMALHGYLDESAMVVAPVWSSAIWGRRNFSLSFVRDTISQFGLDLIWRSANFSPLGLDSWAFRFDTIGYTDDLIEIEQRLYFCSAASEVTYDSYHGVSLTRSPWPVIRSMLAVWEDPESGLLYLPAREAELDALECLKAYIGQELPSPLAREAWRPCILGLELSLKYGKPQLAHGFLSTIATQIASGSPGMGIHFLDLALIPRIGYIVRNNFILRQATGFTSCRARAIAFETFQALDSRFHWGEARPYADLSWINLLSEIESLESMMWDEEQEVDLPFFRPPASSEHISRVEQELGVTLPQDYKEFLAISNGLGSYNRFETAPLLSVEDLYWNTGPDGLKVEYRQFESSSTVARLPYLDRVLQINDVDYDEDVHWWLIEPALIQKAKWSVGENGTAEWLGVNHAKWNPQLSNRGSFRMMMERRLSDLTSATQM